MTEQQLEALAETSNLVLVADRDIVLDNLPDDRLSLRAGSVRWDAGRNITFVDRSDQIQAPGSPVVLQAGDSVTIGSIDTSHPTGSAGAITITATDRIDTGSLLAVGGDRGGAIFLTALNGSLQTGPIHSGGQLAGGSIALDSATGLQVNGDMQATSMAGPGGSVLLRSNGAIGIVGQLNAAGSVAQAGGSVLLRSEAGSINVGGPIITTGGQGGNLTISTPEAATLGNIEVSGQQGPAGQATITGTTITTGNITATGTTGGTVQMTGRNSLTLGAIDVSGQVQGGEIRLSTLEPTQGDIQVASLNAQGGPEGLGGSVAVTATRSFRALATFTDRQGNLASVAVGGGRGDRGLQLQSGGEALAIGQLNATSGLAGAISTSDRTISQGTLTPSLALSPVVGVAASRPPIAPAIAIQTLQSSERSSTEAPETPAAPPGSAMVTVAAPRATAPNVAIDEGARRPIIDRLEAGNTNLAISELDRFYTNDFNTYLGRPLHTSALDLPALQAMLQQAAAQTGVRTAFIYTLMRDDRLSVMLVLPNGEPVSHTVEVPRQQVIDTTIALRSSITNPLEHQSDAYRRPAEQLYQWLLAPIADSLVNERIQSLVFSMDRGLRGLPIAALHDGQQFLIERYSMGMMPSASLLNAQFQSLRQSPVLSFGMSEFQQLPPLPAVPLELAAIARITPSSSSFLNDAFTFANLKHQRQVKPYPILHLATHADFQPGNLGNSFVQLWDRRLAMTELRQLKLDEPPLELLVLSACRTAVGDDTTELGFSGLAVEAGVKSVVASLWSVSDDGTLNLMANFYQALQSAPTKAEALRQAQLSLLRGPTANRLADPLRLREDGAGVPIPASNPEPVTLPLSHPYYWASFVTIGSPW